MPDQPDPPDEWRVYEQDKTPDPEPPVAPPAPPAPSVYPPGSTPNVPYGQQSSYNPVVITSSGSSGAAPKIILLVVALLVLGGVVAGAIAIFSSVGGVPGIGGGIDAKDPEDFEEFVEELEETTGSTEVSWVGLYTNYIIARVPYSDDPTDRRELSYTWRGDDLESTKGTSVEETTFDLTEIDPDVIDGMCDTVLELADGATPDDCYIFISDPGPGGKIWFRTSASDDFTISHWVHYDKDGVEVERGHS